MAGKARLPDSNQHQTVALVVVTQAAVQARHQGIRQHGAVAGARGLGHVIDRFAERVAGQQLVVLREPLPQLHNHAVISRAGIGRQQQNAVEAGQRA